MLRRDAEIARRSAGRLLLIWALLRGKFPGRARTLSSKKRPQRGERRWAETQSLGESPGGLKWREEGARKEKLLNAKTGGRARSEEGKLNEIREEVLGLTVL